MSQDMFLIMQGRVRVEKGDKATPVGEGAVLNQLEPGTTFGEMSFLTAQETCAHCIAETDAVEVRCQKHPAASGCTPPFAARSRARAVLLPRDR